METRLPEDDPHAATRPLTFAMYFQGAPAVAPGTMRRINIVAAAARAHHPGCHVWLLTNEGTKTAGLHTSVNVFRVKNLSPRPARLLVNRLVAEVGPASCCSPCRRMPFSSRNEG